MTAEFDHLAPEFREEAALSSPERIRRIQAERWIGYPRAELILDRLNELPAAFGLYPGSSRRFDGQTASLYT
jgi:Bacterial TniB protein